VFEQLCRGQEKTHDFGSRGFLSKTASGATRANSVASYDNDHNDNLQRIQIHAGKLTCKPGAVKADFTVVFGTIGSSRYRQPAILQAQAFSVGLCLGRCDELPLEYLSLSWGEGMQLNANPATPWTIDKLGQSR
jgi:hypothetical protein